MSTHAALSHAWHSWMSAKAVGALAAIALAVGIGSSTAIYTVVNGVMLTPLPYAHADRFVALYSATTTEPALRGSLTVRDLLEFERSTRSFDLFGWFRPGTFNLTAPGAPQHLDGAAVTPALVQQLGVQPLLGQWLQHESSVVISHGLWTRLGADPQIVGKPMTLSGRTYTIAGVMSRGFQFPVSGPGVVQAQRDVWLPLDPGGRGVEQGEGAYFCYARRKTGVSLAQAEDDVKRVAAEIARRDPAGHPAYTARLDDLRGSVVVEIRPTLLLLFAAAGLLLLITCANVAGLLLARSVSRARETAIRVALGASQRQLAFQYFVEGLLVSLIGAAVGIGVSVALVRVLVSIAAEYIPRVEEIAIDWRVLLFTLGLACLASALSSLAPLWQAARTAPSDVLRDGVRASASLRSRGLSRGLVIAEIGLAFTLLAVSAALVTHLGRLMRLSPGFDPEQIVAFDLTAAPRATPASSASSSPSSSSSSSSRASSRAGAPTAGASSSGDAAAGARSAAGAPVPLSAEAVFQQQLVDAVSQLPGVTSAAIVNQLPLSGCCFGTTLYPDGRPPNLQASERTSFLLVSPDYFRTMKIPLRSGRLIDARDTSAAPLLVVLNEAAARKHWPGRSALGATGRISHPQGTPFQVVGVVGDVRNNGLGNPTVPEIYISSALAPPNPMRFVVRSTRPAESIVPDIRRAVQRVDAAQPIHGVTTMREIVQESMTLERVGSLMMTFFAGAALLMATLGIYGVVAYAVRQGTVEIGTRMALGASPGDVLSLILRGGVAMAAYGVALGSLAVMASAWLLIRVFGLDDLGWAPFAAAAAIVAGVALVASFFPAWRATRVSPMVAIRNQPGGRLTA